MTDEQKIRAKALKCALLSLQNDTARKQKYFDVYKMTDIGQIAIHDAARFIPYIETGDTTLVDVEVDLLFAELNRRMIEHP